jgi:MarR family transcriptional regulator, lower aerobic nicotinate degradation pathway regulator
MSSRFEHMAGHLLRRCHQIAAAIFLDECAAFELTPLQFAVLDSLLGNGPQDQVTLSGAAALDRTTISLVIRKLEQRGLVRRTRSEQDQRAKIVTITATGQKLVEAALGAVEAAQQRIVAPLDDDETQRLLQLLEKLAQGNNALSRAPEKMRRHSAG